MPNAVTFRELGRTTDRRTYDGRTYDAFVPQLSGRAAWRTYEDMSNNDPVIGGILLAIEMLIRNVSWWSEPASQKPADLKAQQFLEECREDMSDTWEDMISEVLTMLVHGWSFHEIVYKYRRGDTNDPKTNSKYTDGLIGWRKMPIRSQESIMRWEFQDDGDGIKAFVQGAISGTGNVPIPMEKGLLFRTKPNRRSPEGLSILRKAYRGWYFKRRMEEIEGIGIERELAGLPVMIAPENLDIWDEDDLEMSSIRQEAMDIIRKVRTNEADGILMPFGWEFDLASTGGRRAIDVSAVIERYDRRNAMTMLGDFILLGHESVGSFSLADVKTNMFAYAIGAWLDVISAVVNRYAIPRLFKLNPRFPQDRYPQVRHGDTEAPNLEELGDFITKMVGSGIVIPGPEIEDYVRSVASLPPKTDEQREIDAELRQQALLAAHEQAQQPSGDGDQTKGEAQQSGASGGKGNEKPPGINPAVGATPPVQSNQPVASANGKK